MKKIIMIYFFCMFVPIFVFTQDRELILQDNIIIREVYGSVQYRHLKAPFWNPLLSGVSLSSQNFIRLNSPDSSLVVSFPDGSLLQLIGIGSIFLDEISQPKNNIYNSKILVLSGRWTYKSHKDYESRLIVNTDITTSVIENGVGGGYFFNGTNEFVIQEGRGVISYRQESAQAIVLDERQFVLFDIYNGFFNPRLVTDEIAEKYFFFEPAIKGEKIRPPTDIVLTNSTEDMMHVYKSAFSNEFLKMSVDYKAQDVFQQSIFSSHQNLSNSTLKKKELNQSYLDKLMKLEFPIKVYQEQITVIKQETKIEQTLVPLSNIKINQSDINPNLLKPINIDDFQITKQVAADTNTDTNTNQTAIPKRRQRQKVKFDIDMQKATNNIESAPKEVSDIDVDYIINELEEQATLEQKKSEPLLLEIIEEPIKTSPLINIRKITTPQTNKSPSRPPIRKQKEQEIERYRAPDKFYNRDLSSDEFQYDTFEINESEDILHSEFNSILYML